MKKDGSENIVIAQTMNIIMDDTILERMTDAVIQLQGQESITIPLMKKQQKETEKTIENMVNAAEIYI